MIMKTTCERMNTNHNHTIEAEEENTMGDKYKFVVLPGRGKGVENHAGNIIYRGLVSASKDLYAKCHERDKKKISLGIVDAVRKIGGRFLTYDEDRKIYTDLDDEKARVKASQALRDALNSRRNSQKENGVYEEEEKRCTNEVPQEWYSNYLYQELMRNHSNSSTRTTDAEQISQREGDRDENVLDSLEPLNYKHDHGLPNRNLTKKSISTRSEFSQLSKDVMSSMSGMTLSTLSLDADMLDVEKFSVPENKNVNVITPGSKRSTSRKMGFPIRESVVDDYEQGMLTVIGKKSASVPEEKLSTLTFNEEGVGQKDNDSFFRLADKVAKNNAGVPLSGHSLMSS